MRSRESNLRPPDLPAAVKRSTDWANPAAVNIIILHPGSPDSARVRLEVLIFFSSGIKKRLVHDQVGTPGCRKTILTPFQNRSNLLVQLDPAILDATRSVQVNVWTPCWTGWSEFKHSPNIFTVQCVEDHARLLRHVSFFLLHFRSWPLCFINHRYNKRNVMLINFKGLKHHFDSGESNFRCSVLNIIFAQSRNIYVRPTCSYLSTFSIKATTSARLLVTASRTASFRSSLSICFNMDQTKELRISSYGHKINK